MRIHDFGSEKALNWEAKQKQTKRSTVRELYCEMQKEKTNEKG